MSLKSFHMMFWINCDNHQKKKQVKKFLNSPIKKMVNKKPVLKYPYVFEKTQKMNIE